MAILFEEKKEAMSVIAFGTPRLNKFTISIKDCVMANFEDWVEGFPIHIWEDCGTEYICYFDKKTGNLNSVIDRYSYYNTEHKQDELMNNAKKMFNNCGYDTKSIKNLIEQQIKDYRKRHKL